jgi:hypothetical protein
MGDVLSGAWQAPIPTILVLAGILFVILSVGATVRGMGGHVSRKSAGVAGIVMLAAGLWLHLETGGQEPQAADSDSPGEGRSPTPTPSPPAPSATSPPTSHPRPPPAPYSKIYRSGPKLSAAGRAFSGWYRVCSDPPPKEYGIGRIDFRLEGDRGCGAWAECRGLDGTRGEACWEFRLQGHEELPAPGQASSEGVLTVMFEPLR